MPQRIGVPMPIHTCYSFISCCSTWYKYLSYLIVIGLSIPITTDCFSSNTFHRKSPPLVQLTACRHPLYDRLQQTRLRLVTAETIDSFSAIAHTLPLALTDKVSDYPATSLIVNVVEVCVEQKRGRLKCVVMLVRNVVMLVRNVVDALSCMCFPIVVEYHCSCLWKIAGHRWF